MFFALVTVLAYAVGLWTLRDRDGSRKTGSQLCAKYAGWMQARPDRYTRLQVVRWQSMAWSAAQPSQIRLRISRFAGAVSLSIAVSMTVFFVAGALIGS